MPGGAACRIPCTALLGATLVAVALGDRPALAFPDSDASSPSIVSAGSAAQSDSSDASALAHQVQLLNAFGNTPGEAGWSITPSITLQEVLNDNIYQTSPDRRGDLITYVTPGLAIYGNTPRVQVRLNYQPSLLYYADNTSLNDVQQQLNAIGDFVLWQDHLYLDVRGLAGVGASVGGAPGLGFGTTGGTAGLQNGTTTNLTKQNSTQFTSFEASPYFLQKFEDYGTLKVGYTINQSSSSNTSGFSPISVTSTGPATSQTTNEELVQFTTGDFLNRISDIVLLDAKQYTTTGISQPGHNNTATNQLSYILNRSITVFGTLGYEDIDYGGTSPLIINDMVWLIGTTLTPNPRSTITVSYGHQNGADNLNVNGLYTLTARTSISVSYVNELGTQLQQVQNQLAAADINNAGSLINSRTGAPLSVGNNLLGTQNELYRSHTATVTTTTLLDRDTLALNAQYSDYIAAGGGATGSTSGISATASWSHELSEDLTLSASGSYGQRWFLDPGGKETYVALTTALTYSFSATLSGSVRYAFYDVNANGQGQSMYQDLFVISLTKQF
jgi:uncharacterized protein (PEP-CTERM system associated)